MTHDELKELVLEEATNLRKFATKEEIKQLDASTIDPSNIERCVYGQMTGTCYSERAIELIENCCSRVIEAANNPASSTKINGSPKTTKRFSDGRSHQTFTNSINYWSPIEVWIELYPPLVPKLISFIKGKRKTIQ